MVKAKKKTYTKKSVTQPEKSENEVDVKPTKTEHKVERQLLKIVGFLALLVVIFFVAKAYFDASRTVEYGGLTFVKETIGNIEAYKYSYFFMDNSNNLINYQLYVRNNPATNSVQVIGDAISFQKGKFVYLSLDTESLTQCSQSILAVADLGRYLTGNLVTVRAGSLTEAEAERLDRNYVTCENQPERVVIELRAGEKTEVVIDGNCHRITVANCEILPATEKYIVQSIIDARTTTPAEFEALPPSIE